MPRTFRPVGILSGLLCLGLALPGLAADKPQGPAVKPKEKTAKPDASKPAPAKPKPKKEADPFAVPNGTPAELLAYIEKVQKMRPEGRPTRQELLQFVLKSRQAMLEAADKILADKPTDEQFTKAAESKLACLELLSRLNAPGAAKKLAVFADQLKKAGKTRLARAAQSVVLIAKANQPGDAAAMKKLLAETRRFLAEGPLTRRDLGLMMTVGQALEYSDHPKLAAEAYKEFAAIAAKSDDPLAARYASRFEAAGRRMALPGHRIKIEGLTMDGKKFDWEKFSKGKVVLVDFWATWCGFCLREIPEMKRLYRAYHDRGFEIVGLAGDDTREPLEHFLESAEIPWTIVYGKEGPSPTIEYYGIAGFPTMILVAKDGKVVSLNARGETLRDELTRLLGPAEEKKPGKKKAEKKETAKAEKREEQGKKAKAE
jgi:thiol-disulfide isomerase/thioredoxin